MPESIDRLVLGKLNHQAYKGRLYQVADTVAATALVPAVFCLMAGSAKGIPIRLISVRVSSSVADVITFGVVTSDPAIGAGNTPSNCYLGGMSPQASNEVAAVAAPALASTLTLAEVGAGGTVELLSPAVLYMSAGFGVALYSSAAVEKVTATWLWAEIPPESF